MEDNSGTVTSMSIFYPPNPVYFFFFSGQGMKKLHFNASYLVFFPFSSKPSFRTQKVEKSYLLELLLVVVFCNMSFLQQ